MKNSWNATCKGIFCLAILSLAFGGAASAQNQPAQKSDVDSVKTFVASVAEFTYKAAWPTATYKDYSLDDISFFSNGFDATVKLEGISAFDGGPLWLQIVFMVRDGALANIKLGHNNAILAQPFQTTAALVALTAELAKDYAAENPQPTSTGQPAVPATVQPDPSPAPPPAAPQNFPATTPAYAPQPLASPSRAIRNPSIDEGWKGLTLVTTRRPIHDPVPKASRKCTILKNTRVALKAGGPDSFGRVTITTLGLPAQKPPPCSYLFFTTDDNLVK